jgi:hypothetical protein
LASCIDRMGVANTTRASTRERPAMTDPHVVGEEDDWATTTRTSEARAEDQFRDAVGPALVSTQAVQLRSERSPSWRRSARSGRSAFGQLQSNSASLLCAHGGRSAVIAHFSEADTNISAHSGSHGWKAVLIEGVPPVSPTTSRRRITQ